MPGSAPLVGTFPVNGGGNTISEPLPKWVGTGTGQVTIVLIDPARKVATYRTTVAVSA